MGTTLQNGVYLPNEGERNCYAGLKTNWEILDQKVADVTALQQAVAGALHREIVESLPTTDIDPNTIYMILSGTSATENVYNEFMYVNNAWELIGTSATDLTNYYTKAEVDGKLLLKANASDLTSHTGDTTIHVTASDKNRWNNQTYVFRYSSTALVASSTNSNALLDNTDNLKVGDKVIDSNGVLFSITAIDSANSTFTIGTALVDLAQDSDVVHNSGNETVAGVKTFTDSQNLTGYTVIRIYSPSDEVGVLPSTGQAREIKFTDKNNVTISYFAFQHRASSAEPFRTCWRQQKLDGTSSYYSVNFNNLGEFYPESNGIKLGISTNRWSGVYAQSYYYGANNVEFSTKFVTTDTAQDISANKNFKGLITTSPDSPLWPVTNNTTADITSLALNCVHIESRTAGSLSDLSGGAWYVAQIGTGCFFFRQNKGTDIRFKHFPTNTVSKICVMSNNNKFISDLCPDTTNSYNLGDSTNKWATINGLPPSSLGMPDLSNGIDISSYITTPNAVSTYTPVVNGWVSIVLKSTSGALGCFATQGDFANGHYSATSLPNENDPCVMLSMPVIGGIAVNIYTKGANAYLYSAKFFPCQGNV